MAEPRLLLDTNALIWIGKDRSGLSSKAVETLIDSELDILVSPISTNEVAMKASQGKLQLSMNVADWVREIMGELNATSLPLTHEHCRPH